MSSMPPIFARTTTLMTSNQFSGHLRQTQAELFDVQRQISTGLRINSPSDSPGQTSAIQFLRRTLGERVQYQSNLQHANMMLNNIDASLKESTDILLEAKNLALGQIGVGSDSETRKTTALTVDAQIDALMNLANSQFNNISLFGGSGGAGAGGAVFESFLGGVRYVGGEGQLHTRAGVTHDPVFNMTGHDAFGALSARIVSQVDLDPRPSEDTLIRNIEGALGEGVRLGAVRVSIDGTVRNVDLSNADNLGDVIKRINAAIEDVDPAAGSLALGTDGYELTANAGHTITIADIGSGKTAADLGLDMQASDETVTGGELHRLLDPMTRLEDLNVDIDWASGLHITQGSETKIADFSNAETVEDLQNVIQQLNLGLRLQINEQRNGFNLVSEVSGIELSIGENGGTTATDLGLRSLDANTALSDFRHGLGVEFAEGEPDLVFALHNGTSFEVNLDGATSVADVIAAIETAAADVGLTVGEGEDFHIDFAEVGNGLVFIDNTIGGEDFKIANASQSHAATHLGIAGNAEAGDTITGTDHAKVKVDSVFTHLIELRDALQADDERGITLAGGDLDKSLERVARAQAQNGVDAQRVQQELARSQDQQIAEESMLSEIQDASLSDVITRFTQLQTQLQASLQVGAQNMQFNLLDFLR